MKGYLKKTRLLKIISKFKQVNILVIGDIILDRYVWGKADRLSPEAPVPVVWANRENYLLGGAANVAFNLSSLGVKSAISGVAGRDFYSKQIEGLMKKEKINNSLVLNIQGRPTTLKTRVIARHQQVVRIDWESSEELSLKINRKIVNSIRRNIDKFDTVVIEDYGKGVINPHILEEVLDICKKKKKSVAVDPKEEHFDFYKGVTVLTPNLKEAQSAANFKVKGRKELNLLGEVLLEKLYPEALLVTLGEEGMRLFLKRGGSFHLPTYALDVFDVSGAGDTVIAVFASALSAGASFLEAAFLSNFAAGIVVSRLGASAVSPSELADKVNKYFDKVQIKKVV